MTDLVMEVEPTRELPSKKLVNATLFWALLLPSVMAAPFVLGIGHYSVGSGVTISVVSLACACCCSYFVIRRWNPDLLVGALVVGFPLLAFTYWLLVSSTIPFGDDEALRPMIDRATTCWSESPLSGDCFVETMFDSRYIASSIYHGLRISIFGDSPIVTVSWGCMSLLSVALLAIPGMSLSGLSKVQATGISICILLWPDFLDMTSWLGRDLIILWAIVAWFTGIRVAVNLRGVLGILLALISIVLIAFTRPIYLPICGVDLAFLILLNKKAGHKKRERRSITYLGLLVIFVIILVAWLNNSFLGLIQNTTFSQAAVAGRGLGTTTSTNVGGALSALTGAGYLISVPVRLIISAVAPFPWTSPQIFTQNLAGFSGNWIALAVHIVKSEIGVAGLLLIPILSWIAIRRRGMRSLIENSCLTLCIGLLMSAGIADAGYSRYIAISYPFLAAMLLCFAKETRVKEQFNAYLAKTVFIAVFGSILVLLIYEVRA